MRDALYRLDAGMFRLVPLAGSVDWPFPLANDPEVWVEITPEQADHFLNVLPPRAMRRDGFMIGEPSTTDIRGVTVYPRVQRVGGRWWIRDVPEDRIDRAIDGLRGALAQVEALP